MIVRDTVKIGSQTFSPSMIFGGSRGYDLASELNQASGVMNFERPAWMQDSVLEGYVNAQHLNAQEVLPEFLQKQSSEDYQGQFRELSSWEDFEDVPPAMQVAIGLMPEIRSGIESGKFAGYGFDPSFYPEEDVFDRLINNGRGDLQKDGTYESISVYKTGDPDLTEQNLEDLERSRDTLRALMAADPDIDPTDPSQIVE